MPVEIVSGGVRPEQRFDALKPTYATFFETAEGELAHKVLSKVNYLPEAICHKPEALRAELEKYYADFASGFPFKFDEGKIVNALSSFLVSREAAPLFAARPGRQVLIEAEFIDKAGSLFRMDRILVDKDSVTVIDFKTGRENTEKYAVQMKNYLEIISEIYAKKAVGLLAYVDLKKIVEIP
jgi:ATP-dependent exoDNAse (exonuclease V) beta subunit